ncbi:MAG TPA: ABC transporter ATP-binding protein [Dehalococcoidia bacterium]|nr:ABC transporter ATP-binding protein [Dehalococcoidia bacterium]
MTSEAPVRGRTALRLAGVKAAYGPVSALHGIDMELREGQVVALLGANGAGKTTVLRVVSGMLAPSAGKVEYMGQDISGMKPSSLVRRGAVHVPENRRLFGEMSVEENLRIGAFSRPWRVNTDESMQLVYGLFPILRGRKKQRAGTLSGGEQQMLAIARALMAEPRLLLLDEPSLGLAPLIVQSIYQAVEALNREQAVTMLLVEQNASVAFDIADYAYVMETGRIVVSGTPDELRGHEDVRRSYLGY